MIYSQSDTAVLGGLTLLTWQSFDFGSLSTRAGRATFIPATFLALFRLQHVAPAEWESGDARASVPSGMQKGCCRGFIHIKSLGCFREDLAAAILFQPPALQTSSPSMQLVLLRRGQRLPCTPHIFQLETLEPVTAVLVFHGMS